MKTQVASRLCFVAIMNSFICYIHLTTENRLDLRQPLKILLGVVAGVMECLESKKITVIGNRYCRHSPLAGAFDQRIYLALPVKQGICCVQM